jgi:hypothetical protein
MRSIAWVAVIAAPLCACTGVRASNIRVGLGEQPVFPLHVHPSLSGTSAPANMRASGRGTRGSPLSPPLISMDYPDPPEFAINPPGSPEAVATPLEQPRPRIRMQRR